jgi:hypothetical protein
MGWAKKQELSKLLMFLSKLLMLLSKLLTGFKWYQNFPSKLAYVLI